MLSSSFFHPTRFQSKSEYSPLIEVKIISEMNENAGIQTFPTPLSSVIHHCHPQSRLQKMQRMSKTRFSLGEGTSVEEEVVEEPTNKQSSLPDLSTGASQKEGNTFVTYNFSNLNLPTCWEKFNFEKRMLLAALTFVLPLMLSCFLEETEEMEGISSFFYSVPSSIFSRIIISCFLPCVSFAAIFGIVTYSWLRQPWSDGAVCLTFWIFLVADFYSNWGFVVLLLTATMMGLTGAIHPHVFRHVGRVDLMFLVFTLIKPSASKSLILLPRFIRSSSGIASCMLGFLLARCLDKPFVFPDISVPALLSSPGSKVSQKSKRRKSSSFSQMDSQTVKRRVSLPSLHSKIQQHASINLDSTLLREAQGILADMMIDPTLPSHLLSSLKAVKNIFKMEWHGGQTTGISRRSRSQGGMMPSSPGLPPPPDAEEWPDVERSTYKSKQRRSVAPCVIRCRSATSSWATTTSATGLPILEPDPGMARSSSRGNCSTGIPSPMSSHPSASSSSEMVTGGRFGQLHGRSGSIQVTNRFPIGVGLPRRSIHVIMTSDYESSGEHGEQTTNDNCIDEADPSRYEHQTKEIKASISKHFLDEETTENMENMETMETIKSHSGVAFELTRHEDDDDDDDQSKDDKTTRDLNHEYINDELQSSNLLDMNILARWDFPIFNLSNAAPQTLLSRVAFKIFSESGFMDHYSIPLLPFLSFFHALETGYHDNFYHNRIHATDVLHAVYYMTTQPIPGLAQLQENSNSQVNNDEDSKSNSTSNKHLAPAAGHHDNDYAVMATNFPTLELMALYTAAAMHDYDHPGRTNAFLVSTANPVAILYNDRSVLENHHVASAWCMLTSDPKHHWLSSLDSAKFKRFRFLVIEAVLATDLKRHFELVAEFNSKVNEVEASGIDWTQEADRLMVANMLVKMADINGPCKPNLLHLAWTDRICREFYEQGDEEMNLGVPVSPFMDRKNPQLAKLQESFINHLVSPLCHALSDAGLLPGCYTEGHLQEDNENSSSDDEDSDKDGSIEISHRHVTTPLVENLKGNVKMWLKHIEEGTIPQALSFVTIPVSQEDVNTITLQILESNEGDHETKTSSIITSVKQDETSNYHKSALTPASELSTQNETPAHKTSLSSPTSTTSSISLLTPFLPTSSPLKVISQCSPIKIKPIYLHPLKFTISKSQNSSPIREATRLPPVDSNTTHTSSQPELGRPQYATQTDETGFAVTETQTKKFSSTESLNQMVTKRRPLRIVKLNKF